MGFIATEENRTVEEETQAAGWEITVKPEQSSMVANSARAIVFDGMVVCGGLLFVCFSKVLIFFCQKKMRNAMQPSLLSAIISDTDI